MNTEDRAFMYGLSQQNKLTARERDRILKIMEDDAKGVLICEVDTRHFTFDAVYPADTPRTTIQSDFLAMSRTHMEQCNEGSASFVYDDQYWNECAEDLVVSGRRNGLWHRDGEPV